MEQTITGNGTVVLYLRPGRYLLSFEGTADAGATVLLKGGASADGSGHVQIKDSNGSDIKIASGSLPEPAEIPGSRYLSLVTSSFGSSSGLKASFRRLPLS